MSARMTRGEVSRIVNAAQVLIDAHGRRNLSSECATLAEESALSELNFQLSVFRQRYIYPTSTTGDAQASPPKFDHVGAALSGGETDE